MKEASSKGRDAALNLVLVAVSTLFALLLAEGLLHLATGRRYLDVDLQLESGPLTWVPSQKTRWKRIEWDITYRINARGFRDNEAFKTPPPILALGDSWTEGYGVEEGESYPKRLERLLGVGVYDAGLQGRSPSNYIEIYRKLFADDKAVKLVTMGFDLSTDIETGPVGQTFNGPVRKNWSYWIKRTLSEHSVLYNFVRRPVRLSPWARPLFAKAGLIPKEPYSPIATDPDNKPHWQYTADLVARFGEELREKGQTLVVVLIPMKLQVEDDTNAQLVASNAMDPKRAQRFAFNEFMADYAKKRGLQVVDLLPAMRAANAAAPHSLYFRTDGHWTREGQRVAAETLAEALRERRLVPRR